MKKIKIVYKNNKGSFLYKIFYTKGFRGLYHLFSYLPLNEKKIVFASDSREEMSGNFLYVYNKLQEKKSNYKYFFMLKNETSAKKKIREVIVLAYHFATSKYIFLDDFYPMIYPLKIRKGADLIQLWHAVGAFKTFGYSRVGKPGGPSINSNNHRNYTKAIVSSKNVAKHYAEGFGISKNKVFATGVPRTDIFFDSKYQEAKKQELHKKYPFLVGKKIITFAPTFRGNGQQSAYYPLEFLNLDLLYKALKDDYIFLFKMHPFVKDYWSTPNKYKNFYYDFSDYREINDLLFITDILITDYSSTCFEFALLKRPMIFYAPDVEEYIAQRDFYYNYYTFIPGPLVRTNDDLIEIIKKDSFDMKKIESFVDYFYDHTDGRSSERVVELILNS